MIPDKNSKNIDTETSNLIVAEAILKRASLIKQPFMLKGSMLTRQYFPNPQIRNILDIDWLYLEKIEKSEDATEIFTKWITSIINMELDDDILFDYFSEDDWALIDYAMTEDFPTAGTSIYYHLGSENKKQHFINVDISFNLNMKVSPLPITYKPLYGNEFVVPYTAPLSVQVSWKLHQTIVRPRFKDLNDLIYLMSHEKYNKEEQKNTLESLKDELSADESINEQKVKNLFCGNMRDIYDKIIYDSDLTKHIHTPEEYETFKYKFISVMKNVGFNEKSYDYIMS